MLWPEEDVMSNPIEKYKRPKPFVEFTLERKQEFLDLFRNHPDLGGRKGLCAEAVGVAASTVQHHVKNDPEFAEAYQEAHQAWIDENLFTPALKRARDGVEKPIIGGKFKDEIICHVREYSDSLTLALLRAHRPEFRDNQAAAGIGVGGGQTGGVMIVPAAPLNMEDWQKHYGDMAKGNTGKAEAKS